MRPRTSVVERASMPAGAAARLEPDDEEFGDELTDESPAAEAAPEVVLLTASSAGAGLQEALTSLVSAPPQPFPPPEADAAPVPEPPARELEQPPEPEMEAATASAEVDPALEAEVWPPPVAAAGTGSAHQRQAPPAHEEGHLEQLSETFFASPHDLEPLVSWEEVEAPEMTEGARRAMLATGAILGVSLLAMAVFVGYHRFVMPVPVELGEAAQLPPAIPQPLVPPAAPTGSVLSAIGAPATGADRPQPATAETAAAASGDQDGPAAEAAPADPAQDVSPVAPSEAIGDAPSGTDTAEPGPLQPAADSPVIVGEAEVVARGTIPDDSGFAAMLGTANTLYRRGRSAEALEAYHRALSFRPDAPQALSRIAYIHLNAGDNVRARQFAARAVEIDPASSEGWIVLGASLAALGDRPGALTAYKKCATLGTGSYVVECRRLSR